MCELSNDEASAWSSHRRRTHEQVFVRLQGCFEQLALNAIKSFEAFESSLGVLGQLVDGDEHLMEQKMGKTQEVNPTLSTLRPKEHEELKAWKCQISHTVDETSGKPHFLQRVSVSERGRGLPRNLYAAYGKSRLAAGIVCWP